MPEIAKMRLPTCDEWDRLVNAIAGKGTFSYWLPTFAEWRRRAKDSDFAVMHWEGMLSWCQDVCLASQSHRAVRGYLSICYWHYFAAANRYLSIGFRPAVENVSSSSEPDGAVVMIGTLYMDEQPVKVPQNPTHDGDITDYIPGAKLELREALDDPAYQVQAIKVGNVLIADRVLLKNISWDDIRRMDSVFEQGSCPMRHPTNGNCLPAGEFCTAVNDEICATLHSAYDMGGCDLLRRIRGQEKQAATPKIDG